MMGKLEPENPIHLMVKNMVSDVDCPNKTNPLTIVFLTKAQLSWGFRQGPWISSGSGWDGYADGPALLARTKNSSGAMG
jgi:hypothetical protein